MTFPRKAQKLLSALSFLFTCFIFSTTAAFALDGDIDQYYQTGIGINGGVNAVAVQPDGKVLIGGWFTQISGVPAVRIGRLNVDGTVDTTFRTGDGFSDDVLNIVVQADGKILVAGEFNFFNGENCSMLARLNPDGSRDLSFVGTDIQPRVVPGFVQRITLQPDGKILIAGNFRFAGGASANGIARLNPDGSSDTSFNTGTGTFYSPVVGRTFAVALQPDGKILIGGEFSHFNNIPRPKIARLMPNGALDQSFAPPVNDFLWVSGIGIQPDGKIIYGGQQQNFVTNFKFLHRVNADGSVDPTFIQTNGGLDTAAQIDVQPDGKILVTTNGLVKLLSNGQGDPSFVPDPGYAVKSSAILPDGRIVIGGQFGTDDFSTYPHRVGRLSSSGAYDSTFAVRRIIGGGPTLAVQPDGKAVTVTSHSLIRRNKDGTYDPTFNPAPLTGPDPHVLVVELQRDGKMLIVGSFLAVNGTPRPGLARLNADGSFDPTFDPARVGRAQYQKIKIQPDGKILVVGDLSTSTSPYEVRTGIIRLNPDGSLDSSFITETVDPPNSPITALALQPDGKIVIVGWFRSIAGVQNAGVARLNSNGALDTNFDAGIGIIGASQNPAVDAVAIQADGKVIIGGTFTSYQGTPRNRIARLNPNGSLDLSFIHQLTGTESPVLVRDIVIQRDGKILIAEANCNDGCGRAPVAVVRVNTDGSIDNTWVIDTRYNIDGKMVLEPDGNLLATGSTYSEAPWILSRRGLVRYLNPSQAVSLTTISGRVTTPAGLGVRNAVVTLTDDFGVRQTATTSSFGIFSFSSVIIGQNYTLSVASKRYRFSPMTMAITGPLSGIELVGLE